MADGPMLEGSVAREIPGRQGTARSGRAREEAGTGVKPSIVERAFPGAARR